MIELNLSYAEVARTACVAIEMNLKGSIEAEHAQNWILPFITMMAKICDEVEQEKLELDSEKPNPWH